MQDTRQNAGEETPMTMKKIKGTVTESLIVQKEVEVEVPDGATREDLIAALRAKAYEKTIMIGDHGWDVVDSEGVDISIEGEEEAECKRCGTNLDKDGYCKDETCPHSDYLQTETWVEG